MEDTLIMDDAVINKYFAGETSDREEQFLMAWLEESEEHRKYFFELKSIWNARNVFAESADLGRFAAFMRSTDARIAKSPPRSAALVDERRSGRAVGGVCGIRMAFPRRSRHLPGL